MSPRVVFYVVATVVALALIFGLGELDLSRDRWRGLFIGTLIILVFSNEERFLRWWGSRRT